MTMASYDEVRGALSDALREYNPDFNIYGRIPRTLVPPAVILKPRPHRSVLYPRAQSSPFAEWHWIVQIVTGSVDNETSQDEIGAMISPGSRLICALESARVARGFVQVVDGAMSEMMVEGIALYTHAELSVYVKA